MLESKVHREEEKKLHCTSYKDIGVQVYFELKRSYDDMAQWNRLI